jgi:hypothetical protein
MRNLLIFLLIAAMCATSVEAAIDYHGHATEGGEQVSFHFGHDDHESDGCDHCCHVSGHLLGIAVTDGMSLELIVSRISPRVSTAGINRAAEPPTPPPNI